MTYPQKLPPTPLQKGRFLKDNPNLNIQIDLNSSNQQRNPLIRPFYGFAS